MQTANTLVTPESVKDLLQELAELKKQHEEVSQAGFELISAQTKLQSLLHNATDGIITFNPDGTVATFNLAAQHIFGYTEGEVISRKIPDLIPCPDWADDNVAEYIRYFILSRSSENVPLPGKHRMGFDILLYVSTGLASQHDTTLFDDEQDVTLFDDDLDDSEQLIQDQTLVCFFRDITLNKKLEKELSDQKQALDFAAGVMLMDQDFRIVDVNEKFCQILGRERKEFIGEFNQNVIDISHCETTKNTRRKQSFLSDGNAWSGETCYQNKQNQRVWLKECSTPFLDEDHKPYQFLSILNDITQQKKIELELKQHRDHLQDLINEQLAELIAAKNTAEIANQAKSEFLNNISHELRTPMHSILSFTQLGLKQLQKSDFKELSLEKLKRFLNNIDSSGQRLLALLNDLLDLAKLETGKVDYQFENKDFCKLIKQIISENEAKLAAKSIDLDFIAETDEYTIFLDWNRIAQVINNLFSNAIKFAPENSRIIVNLEKSTFNIGRRKSDTIKKTCILFTITDQGPGIPETELGAVFDKFIQSSKTKSGAGGTGLGLAICKEIIAAHQGRIWAEPNPEGGALFKFLIPENQENIKFG